MKTATPPPRSAPKARATAAATRQATAPAGSPQAALAAAIELLRTERIEEAEPALLAVLQRWPEQPDALHFLGVLRHTQGRTDEAVDLIHRALALAPQMAGAWSNLGNVLLLAGRLDEALSTYESAVRAAGTQADAKLPLNNLCSVLRRLNRLADSEAAARRALALDPAFADAWHNLSLTLIRAGQIHEGVVAHSRAVALWPQHLQPRHEVIRALMLLGEHARASTLLRQWLAEDEANPVALHLLAACQGHDGPTPERASDAYVQQVFDHFAASFDAKLEALGYRAPALVVQALADAVGPAAAALDLCDAGCGTGLVGPPLRPWARRLAGCDLSVGMLRRARERKVYDQLHQAELTHYLATQPGAFDAVISADTLCYFGALETAVGAAFSSLRPGGWLVFTVEALPEPAAAEAHEAEPSPSDAPSPSPEPHRLQANGRYAHASTYLRTVLAASGFAQPQLTRCTLRLEAGEPVVGWLVVAQRPAA